MLRELIRNILTYRQRRNNLRQAILRLLLAERKGGLGFEIGDKVQAVNATEEYVAGRRGVVMEIDYHHPSLDVIGLLIDFGDIAGVAPGEQVFMVASELRFWRGAK